MNGAQFQPQDQVSNPVQRQQANRYAKFIHNLLTAGVLISSLLLTSGLIIGLVRDGTLPSALPALTEVIPLALAQEPAGLIALGLMVLIATPILRVFGSILTFIFERDWRYAIITSVVLLIVVVSIISGGK